MLVSLGEKRWCKQNFEGNIVSSDAERSAIIGGRKMLIPCNISDDFILEIPSSRFN